jgi:hypothetical protein
MQLDSVPLWVFFLATMGLVTLFFEAGFHFGKRKQLPAGEKSESSSAMVGALMALVGFMLAFTFSSASSRYDVRRGLVIEETNAIGTTYLRAGILPEPYGTQIRGLLRDYVDSRVNMVGKAKTERDQEIVRSEALQDKIWALAQEVGKKDAGAVTTGIFIQSLNEMIDLHLKRVSAGIRDRIPFAIWATLYLLTIVTMAAMGFHIGLGGSRQVWLQLALIFSFSAVLGLISDLDRPQKGTIKVSQQAMIELQNKLNTPGGN